MNEHTPTYEFRAQTCETLDWLCGFCGHISRSKVARTTWCVQCKGKECRRWFAFGTIFFTLPHSNRQPIPPPDITFPAAYLDRWESGGLVNRFEEDHE